jgi:hypothetical protein
MEPDLPGPEVVSLRGFKKLRMLNCDWPMLRPETKEEQNSQHDEPLEEGYYREEQHGKIEADFDVRTILPESIEELYLGGHIDVDEEWERLANVFDAPSASIPHLTMDKTCINRGGYGVQIGNAERRSSIWSHPCIQLFEGHGV